jgi:ketosteroid isomerase-like protein
MIKARNPFDRATPHLKLAHVAIVLDRSGSMESCRDETISGFNEYAQHIRSTAQSAGLDTRLTLTVFNGDVRMPLFDEPLERLHPMSRKSYVPDGSTAMLDAVGQTIDRLERDGSGVDEASVLICIISDGKENSSTDYTYESVAERITRLTGTERWTFTYMGSNQDLSIVSRQLDIPVANTAAYASTREGTSEAWKRQSRATSRRMESVRTGTRSSQDFYSDEPDPGK